MNEKEIVLPVSGLFARMRMPTTGEWMQTQRTARATGDAEAAIMALAAVCCTLDGEYSDPATWLKLPAPDGIAVMELIVKMATGGFKK